MKSNRGSKSGSSPTNSPGRSASRTRTPWWIFKTCKGWTLELYDGAQGELRRSREQQLWGQYVAKIVYSGARAESRVIARPPQPIPIPGQFDSIDLWGYGNRWEWVPDPDHAAGARSPSCSRTRGERNSGFNSPTSNGSSGG